MKDASVEGLRGLSALSVLGYHVLGFGALASTYFRLGLGGGFAAVYVFFALSAYLLVGRPVASWAAYYRSRMLRIFPTWLVVLPLYSFVGLIPLTPWAMAAVQNWIPWASPTPNPSWTLSIEVVFYAALPAWRWALDRRPWTLWTGCLVVTVAAYLVPWGPYDLVIPSLCLLAYASGSLARAGRLPILPTWAAGAGLVAAFGTAAWMPQLAPITVGLAAGAALPSLPALLGRAAGLGSMAYPLYLVGYPLEFVMRSLTSDPWVVAGTTVALSLAAAALLHVAIEAPALRWTHRRPSA